jgi:hypothetical protein
MNKSNQSPQWGLTSLNFSDIQEADSPVRPSRIIKPQDMALYPSLQKQSSFDYNSIHDWSTL